MLFRSALSLEPAWDSGSPSLSAPPPLWLCLSVSKINKHLKKRDNKSKNELLGPHEDKKLLFCTEKVTISKTKRQLMEWEKILANDISDKGLVSKIYKELIKLGAPGWLGWLSVRLQLRS